MYNKSQCPYTFVVYCRLKNHSTDFNKSFRDYFLEFSRDTLKPRSKIYQILYPIRYGRIAHFS